VTWPGARRGGRLADPDEATIVQAECQHFVDAQVGSRNVAAGGRGPACRAR
jgi:hypothetical protein